MQAPKCQIDKLHKVIMSAARVPIGSYCFRKICDYILNKCKWLCINKMIINSALNITFKSLSNKKPKSIMELYKDNISQRVNIKWYTKYRPKNKIMKQYYIYRTLDLFYNLPADLKNSTIMAFKRKLKEHLRNTMIETYDTND